MPSYYRANSGDGQGDDGYGDGGSGAGRRLGLPQASTFEAPAVIPAPPPVSPAAFGGDNFLVDDFATAWLVDSPPPPGVPPNGCGCQITPGVGMIQNGSNNAQLTYVGNTPLTDGSVTIKLDAVPPGGGTGGVQMSRQSATQKLMFSISGAGGLGTRLFLSKDPPGGGVGTAYTVAAAPALPGVFWLRIRKVGNQLMGQLFTTDPYATPTPAPVYQTVATLSAADAQFYAPPGYPGMELAVANTVSVFRTQRY